MKRYAIMALALVLGCTVFTGCRRGNSNMDAVSPTNQIMPQSPATTPATRPSAPITTEPATGDMTEGSTNGGATDSTETGTGETTPRSRGMTH